MGFGFNFEDDYWTATDRYEDDRKFIGQVLEDIKYKAASLGEGIDSLFHVLGIPDNPVTKTVCAEVILLYVHGKNSKDDIVTRILEYGK